MKLTMLSKKRRLHCCIIIIALTTLLFSINHNDNTDFMYITSIPGVLGNNFCVITTSLNKLTKEQTKRNNNNKLGTRAILKHPREKNMYL